MDTAGSQQCMLPRTLYSEEATTGALGPSLWFVQLVLEKLNDV